MLKINNENIINSTGSNKAHNTNWTIVDCLNKPILYNSGNQGENYKIQN